MPNELGYQFDRVFAGAIERYRQVSTIAERDAIPTGKRWEGMLCYVTGENKDYQLRGGTTNLDWDEVAVGGGNLFDTTANDSDDITEGVTNLFLTSAERAKIGYITITQAVDLDQLESDVAALGSGVTFKGTWSPSGGSFPGGGTTAIGDLYIADDAGTIDSVSFSAGDGVIATVVNASTTTFAGNWAKTESVSDVTSVAGLTGVISDSALRAAINVEDGATADQTGSEIRALLTALLGSAEWETQLTTEDVMDIIGAGGTAGTQTRIQVTYDDPNGRLDFVVEAPILVYSNLASLIAGQGDQSTTQILEVEDASGFTTVTSGRAWVRYLGTTNGDETDYRIVSKSETAVVTAPIPLVYADDTALFAGQGNQTLNYIYEVTDGSGFTGITSGAIWVKYLGTTVGDETDYIIMSAAEAAASPVLSVHGRTGTVVAQAGDYNASQVTDAFDKGSDTSDNVTEGAANLYMTVAERNKLDGIEEDAQDFFNGVALDSPVITVTSDGASITLDLEASGGGDVRFIFSDGPHTHDCTPPDEVTLTAGSDTSPQINYVYILQSTKALTVSTTGWPATEHAPIGTVLCQSVASLQTDGAYKVHAWTDHAAGSNNQGHLSHLNYWIRQQKATWQSGVVMTPTITTNGGAEDNIDIATSAGVVLQLHPHTYPAFDTGVSSEVYVVNDNTAAYTKITDLNAADEDDAGNTITNNKWTNLVVWGVVNEATGDCKLMVNLPSAFHSSESGATEDVQQYSNYTIPADFTGVGFLIARLTFKYTTAASGTWTLVENLDLRTTASVGGGGGSVVFPDNVFRIQDDSDNTKEIAFESSGIATANTRTITMPDKDVDLGEVGLVELGIACSDEDTGLTTGTAKATFRMPFAMTLTDVRANVKTAPTGSVLTVDINESGSTILSTKLTIDATEKTSETAATPPVISDSALADDSEITVDIDTIGSTVAGSGLKIWLIGNRT